MKENKATVVELESVPGLLNKSKRLDIDYFDWTKEVGGVIMGHVVYGSSPTPLTPSPKERGGLLKGRMAAINPGWSFEVDGLLQMPNAAEKKDRYKVPNIIVFSWFLMLWYIRHPGSILKGVTIIGEFHSDYYNKLGFSKQDEELIMKRCRRHGIWVSAVMIHKHRNIGKLGFTVHKYNKRTFFKKRK